MNEYYNTINKYQMKFTLILILILSLYSSLYGQRMPDRFLVFNPLFDTSENLQEDSTGYINSFGGFAEFATYGIKRDFEHAWNQKLGTFVEFFRTGSTSSLAFVANIEFVANSDNDIGFKPRSIFWEEGFVYSQKTGNNYWQLGYMHRCKHDIDNYNYGKERALIFGSLHGKYLIPLDVFDEKDNALFGIRGEFYSIRQDYRIPQNTRTITPNWNQLIGSLGFNFNFTKQISNHYWNYYFNSYSMVNIFSENDGFLNRFKNFQKANINGGISTGIAIRGKAEFRIGLTYDYFSDTGINPVPENAHLISIGVVILNHNSFR
jgi:hypothetical protein